MRRERLTSGFASPRWLPAGTTSSSSYAAAARRWQKSMPPCLRSARLDEPDKRWKFSLGDLDERKLWDDYIAAYQAMLSKTSTEWAPWYVVPADSKWIARAVVADVLTSTVRSLDLDYPAVNDEKRAAISNARDQLESEGD